ncbi:hypothetical protein EGR_05878 [Echinococcus granulosus]|uniref:Uncharacterized protein n=1 Tax=Echinococcus granulosus TaxID=6210 RepID=W6UMD0_ECHGR|nr:hypothetical protein EGR_05878 [Echinococcus granulosus]EUB59277.1 hypothetical protein EGR_05878 [Echinococcus granulosus]
MCSSVWFGVAQDISDGLPYPLHLSSSDNTKQKMETVARATKTTQKPRPCGKHMWKAMVTEEVQLLQPSYSIDFLPLKEDAIFMLQLGLRNNNSIALQLNKNTNSTIFISLLKWVNSLQTGSSKLTSPLLLLCALVDFLTTATDSAQNSSLIPITKLMWKIKPFFFSVASAGDQ